VPHQVHERKFGRTTDQRRAMLRNLTVSVLRYERIKTTEAKAKEIRRFVDRMIGLGKDGTLPARRRALAWLPEPEIVEKVFGDLALRYPDRASGYLRITRVGHRVGDAAPVVHLELMPGADEVKKAREAAEAEEKPRRRLPFSRSRTKTTASKDAQEGSAPPKRARSTASKEAKA
jgi:large subunit ribosomal protein L17